jgi:hypothetical protein
VDANDIASVRNAMIRLYQDKELCNSLGENLYNAVDIKFDKQNFITDRVEAYSLAKDRRLQKPPLNPLQSIFK